MDEEYELMPQNSLSQLKKELENLKNKASGENINSIDLQNSIQKLSTNLNEMIALFKTATDEMKYEEQENKLLSMKIDPISSKLDLVIEQNEQIAKGIVAVADMIKEQKIHNHSVEPKKMARPKFDHDPFGIDKPPMEQPLMQSMGRPQMPSMSQPPMPPMGRPLPGRPMVPPPMPEKKKGLLGMFKK